MCLFSSIRVAAGPCLFGIVLATFALLREPETACGQDCAPEEIAKLISSKPGRPDYFGRSVTFDGVIAVGVPTEDNAFGNAGAVYVFKHRRNGTWTPAARLLSPDPEPNEYFGWLVASQRDTLLVGAVSDAHAGPRESGSVLVYARAGHRWELRTRLLEPEPREFGHFGHGVAIDGDTILIGSEFRAYVFVKSGEDWSLQARFDGERFFGRSVALQGDTAVVGVVNFSGISAAYVFAREGETWSRQAHLVAPQAGTALPSTWHWTAIR